MIRSRVTLYEVDPNASGSLCYSRRWRHRVIRDGIPDGDIQCLTCGSQGNNNLYEWVDNIVLEVHPTNGNVLRTIALQLSPAWSWLIAGGGVVTTDSIYCSVVGFTRDGNPDDHPFAGLWNGDNSSWDSGVRFHVGVARFSLTDGQLVGVAEIEDPQQEYVTISPPTLSDGGLLTIVRRFGTNYHLPGITPWQWHDDNGWPWYSTRYATNWLYTRHALDLSPVPVARPVAPDAREYPDGATHHGIPYVGVLPMLYAADNRRLFDQWGEFYWWDQPPAGYSSNDEKWYSPTGTRLWSWALRPVGRASTPYVAITASVIIRPLQSSADPGDYAHQVVVLDTSTGAVDAPVYLTTYTQVSERAGPLPSPVVATAFDWFDDATVYGSPESAGDLGYAALWRARPSQQPSPARAAFEARRAVANTLGDGDVIYSGCTGGTRGTSRLVYLLDRPLNDDAYYDRAAPLGARLYTIFDPSRGVQHMVWQSVSGAIQYGRRLHNDAAITGIVTVAAEGTEPTLSLSHDGGVRVDYRDGANLDAHAQSRDAGRTWT
jgi:hypothetical protein